MLMVIVCAMSNIPHVPIVTLHVKKAKLEIDYDFAVTSHCVL